MKAIDQRNLEEPESFMPEDSLDPLQEAGAAASPKGGALSDGEDLISTFNIVERMIRQGPEKFLCITTPEGKTDWMVYDGENGTWSRNDQAYRALYQETVANWHNSLWRETPSQHRGVLTQKNRLFRFLVDRAKTQKSAEDAVKQFGDVIKSMKDAGNLPRGLLFHHPEDLDPPGYLATPSGVLNLKDGKLIKPKDARNLLVTRARMIPEEYDPEAVDCDVDKLFSSFETQSSEEFEYFMNQLAFSLYGRPGRRIVVLRGRQGNEGKTTFFNALRAALGQGIVQSFNGDSVKKTRGGYKDGGRPRPDLFVFTEALIAYSGDTFESGDQMNKEVLKQLSGDEMMNERRLHENNVQRRACATLFLIGNAHPWVGLGDSALYDRIKAVDWPPLQEKPDRGLGDRIAQSKTAKQAIVAELVTRAAKLYDKETGAPEPPSPPESVASRTKQWREDELSPIQRWVEERLRKKDGETLAVKDAFEAFLESLSDAERYDQKGEQRYKSSRYFSKQVRNCCGWIEEGGYIGSGKNKQRAFRNTHLLSQRQGEGE